MFKIGDFSKLSCISVKTLRYYDELGLLKPAHVDHFTGYRYYSADQMPRLNRILALKDLGFSLEQTRRLLEGLLLPALMREAEPVIGTVLRDANLSPGQVSARVEEVLRAQSAGA
jgi:DNA-binding transcriptional MerR regulator